MRKNFSFIIHVFLIGIFMMPSLAISKFDSMMPVSTSIEWQKVQFINNVKDYVSEQISPIIKSGEYIIDVKVDVSDKPTSGGDDNKKKPPKIKFNDVAVEAQGDYVLFNKLGLEAPLYDEEGEKSEIKQWQEAVQEIHKKNDLFAYVKAINVDIKFDNELEDSTKKTLQELAKNMQISAGKVKAQVKTSFISMKEAKKTKKKSIFDDLEEALTKFSTALGLIIAALVFGLFLMLALKKYAEMQDKNILKQIINQDFTQKQKDKEQKEKEENEKIAKANGAFGAFDEDGLDGMERFKKFLNDSPLEASLLVKKWIKQETRETKEALIAVVNELESPELLKIFENLTSQDRKVWKNLLNQKLSEEKIEQAKIFIGSQIIDDIIVPPVVIDPEISDILLSLTPEQSSTFVKNNPKLGSILMNVMNTNFISKMMEQIDNETLDQVIENSVVVDKDYIRDNLGILKTELSQFKRVEEQSPFMEKISDLVAIATIDKEESLYKGMAKANNLNLLLETGKNYFPSALIEGLSDDIWTDLINKYNRQKRTDLIAISSEVQAQRIMDILGPVGSKMRDMLNIELERFKDESVKKKIMANKATIWKDFVEHTRKLIRNDEKIYEKVRPTIESWANGLLKSDDSIIKNFKSKDSEAA